MRLIGIAGHFGAGKDVIAAYLIRAHGYVRRGFADALKTEVMTTLRPVLHAYAVERDPLLAVVVAERGPDACADALDDAVYRLLYRDRTPLTRALLQAWGTDLRRREDPDYWVLAWARWARSTSAERVVVPDVRFRNEVALLRSLGARIIRVSRPGSEGDAHQSERELAGHDDWDAVFTNAGTIRDLEEAVEAWLTLP